MKKKSTHHACRRWLCLAGLLLLPLLTTSCGASDAVRPGPLREEASKLENKSRELKEAGRHEEALQAMRSAEELRARAGQIETERGQGNRAGQERRRQLKQELAELTGQLEKARSENQQDRAAQLKNRLQQVERELDRIGNPPGPKGEPARQRDQFAEPQRRPETQPEGRPELERRQQHVQVAIDNLRAAGWHEPAERLSQDLERLQQELRTIPSPGPQGGRGPNPELEELRAELRELRQAMQELRSRIEELGRPRK